MSTLTSSTDLEACWPRDEREEPIVDPVFIKIIIIDQRD